MLVPVHPETPQARVIEQAVRALRAGGLVVYPTAFARTLPSETRGLFTLTEKLVYALKAGCTYVEVGLTHRNCVHNRSKAVSVKIS